MTRQNVTDGPREILTRGARPAPATGSSSLRRRRRRPERRLRALAAQSPRTKAFKVELNAHVASLLIGPGAPRLKEIEDITKRRFLLDGKDGTPLDHFAVLDRGRSRSSCPMRRSRRARSSTSSSSRSACTTGRRHGQARRLRRRVGGAAKLVGKKVQGADRASDGRHRLRDARRRAPQRVGADHRRRPGREADARDAAQGRPSPSGRQSRSRSRQMMRKPTLRGSARGQRRDRGRRDRGRGRDRGADEEEDPPRLQRRPAPPQARNFVRRCCDSSEEGADEVAPSRSPSRTRPRRASTCPIPRSASRTRTMRRTTAPARPPAALAVPPPLAGCGDGDQRRRAGRGQGAGAGLRAGGGGRDRGRGSEAQEDAPRLARRTAPEEGAGRRDRSSERVLATLVTRLASPHLHAYDVRDHLTRRQAVPRPRGQRLLVDRLAQDEGKTFHPTVLFVGGNGKSEFSPRARR